MSLYLGTDLVAATQDVTDKANTDLSNLTSSGDSKTIKTGVILPYAGSSAPTGYLKCDGSAISRSTYANLYSVIGTTYGSGDGSTTFNLPNLQDKFLEGVGTNSLGAVKSAGLPNIQGEINSSRIGYWDDATHTGAFNDSYQRGSGSAAGYDSGHKPIVIVFKASTSNSIYGNSTTVQPPAVCVNYIIKY